MGSSHYKTGDVEPIDLYRSLGGLRAFAVCSIIKYASRNVGGGWQSKSISIQDMDKIIHFAEILKTLTADQEAS